MDEQQLSRLIGRIYESVVDRDEHHAVMGQVAEATKSRFLMPALMRVGEHALEQPQYYGDMTGRMLDGIVDYNAGAGALDPTIAFVNVHPAEGRFASHVHLGGDEHARHPHVKWNRHYIGSAHWQVRYETRNGILFGVSAHPRDPEEPHTPDENRRFDLLFDHMARAWRLALQPADLSSRDDALVTLNAAGRVTAMSPAALAIIQAKDGLYVSGAELLPSEVRLQARWRGLIDGATRDAARGEGAMLLTRPSGRRPLSIIVNSSPPQPGLGTYARGATVRIVDPEAAAPDLTRRLVDLWRLTPAEARLAQVLVETDCDLRESADRLGITYGTARTQLASVFAKTETRGQPELMRLVTRLSD